MSFSIGVHLNTEGRALKGRHTHTSRKLSLSGDNPRFLLWSVNLFMACVCQLLFTLMASSSWDWSSVQAAPFLFFFPILSRLPSLLAPSPPIPRSTTRLISTEQIKYALSVSGVWAPPFHFHPKLQRKHHHKPSKLVWAALSGGQMEYALSEAYTMELTVGEDASKMATRSKMQCGPVDKPLETETMSFWRIL